MSAYPFPLPSVQSYVGGKFITSKAGRLWKRENPFKLSQILYEWTENLDLADEAIERARDAWPEWKQKPLKDRIAVVNKLHAGFLKREREIAFCISRESGKALWEAQAEAKALSAKIKLTVDFMLPMMQQLEEAAREESSYFKFLSRGVCTVYGPFNFPVHLANGHIIPALLFGNVVIFKPSEYTSASASLYSQVFQEAGFPVGVYQMLLGGVEVGKRLAADPRIDGIFFTGSSKVGKQIVNQVLDTHKDFRTIVALELGGKNAAIVHEDADLDLAVSSCILSSFATAGQRCTCSSRIFVHENIYANFRDVFLAKTKLLKTGDPLAQDTFIGPMIHSQAVERYMKSLETSRDEGFQVLLESEQLDASSCVLSPSVYESQSPETDSTKFSLQEEFFGPNTILVPYSDVDELVRWHERTPYGLATSLFSPSQELFDHLDQRIQVGLFNWNRPTVGASSKLPFGGWKRSGNHWPAGSFSGFYCSQPRSYLVGPSLFDKTLLPASLRLVWEEEVD